MLRQELSTGSAQYDQRKVSLSPAILREPWAGVPVRNSLNKDIARYPYATNDIILKNLTMFKPS